MYIRKTGTHRVDVSTKKITYHVFGCRDADAQARLRLHGRIQVFSTSLRMQPTFSKTTYLAPARAFSSSITQVTKQTHFSVNA
jgi:hypothetical protein